jgi:hypothetical protein
MAAGDINDALSNIPWITVQDKVADPADQGAGYAPIYVKNGVLMWLPHGGSAMGVLANPMTTLDDLILAGASGVPGRLGVGSDNQVLTVSPSTHHPVWATPSSGGSYILIAHTVLGADTATISFSSIPGTYTHLSLDFMLRSTASAHNVNLQVTVNDDTGANYSWFYRYWNYAGAVSTGYNGDTKIIPCPICAASQASGRAGQGNIRIFGYANTTWKKHLSTLAMSPGADAGANFDNYCGTGFWDSAAAITKITLAPASGNFLAGSLATLYGLSGA